jgi:hypothetical protein
MAVQGFLASLTLDGNDITQQVSTTPLDRTKGVLTKTVMDGTGVAQSIPGVQAGTLAVTGFLSQAEHNAMEVTWAKDDPVPFVLTVEEGLATDAVWTGLVTLTSFTVNPQEDGLWEFSISGDTSGATVYTPSAP